MKPSRKKPGRNEPCPCGGGKKYKFCHNSLAAQTKARKNAPSRTIQMNYREEDFLNVSGSYHRQLIQPLYVGREFQWRTDARRPLRDTYRVTMTLARDDPRTYELDNQTGRNVLKAGDLLEGDSFIRLVDYGKQPDDKTNSAKAILLTERDIFGKKDELRVEVTSNKQGRLAKLSADISADSFYEAEAAMFDAVSPYLSMLSLYHDLPFRVVQVHVEQMSTGCLWWTCTHPYFDRILYVKGPMTADRVYSPFIRGLFALYREGINGNSLNYQFLCWYKILEAINWKRSNDASSRGLSLSFPERLPATEEKILEMLAEVFPSLDGKKLKPNVADHIPTEILGWKFNRIRQEKLEPVRNKIAHMLTDPTGDLGLSPDDTRHIDEVKNWLTVLRVIARVMIANELPRESDSRRTV